MVGRPNRRKPAAIETLRPRAGRRRAAAARSADARARSHAGQRRELDPDGRLQEWIDDRPRAGTLVARDRACVWHPYTQMLTRPEPLPIVRGEGVYLYTEDGRRLLDGTSSWWVNIHGHSHPG